MPKNKDVSNQETKIMVDEEISKSKSGMSNSRGARVDTEEYEEGANTWVREHEQMFAETWVRKQEQMFLMNPTAGCWMENMIYSVPTVMMGNLDATKLFYPAVIGMGPLHFHYSEDVGFSNGGAMRRIKEEALSLIVDPHSPIKRKQLMDELLSLIGNEEVTIRASYSNPVRIPHFLEGKAFAWMMVVDACFLLVALSILSSITWVPKDRWPAPALLEDNVSLRAGDLLQDLLKMENQIPLWVVRKVAEHLPGWEPETGEISKRVDMETVLTELSPFRPSLSHESGSSTSSRSRSSTPRWRRCYSERKGTLLYLLLLFIIGDPQNDAESAGRSDQSVPACKRALHALGSIIPVSIRSLLKLSWKMLNETRTLTRGTLLLHRERPWPFHLAANIVSIVAMLRVLAITLVLLLTGLLLLPLVALLCLPLLLVVCMWREKDDDHNIGAQALANFGVSISTTTASNNISSVDWIPPSDGLSGKLLLPFLILDEVAMVALWNMLILEYCCPKLAQTKSLSNYIHLMSCVLASFDDLERLRRHGVIGIPSSDQQHRPNQLLPDWWRHLKNSAPISNKWSTDDGSVDRTRSVDQTHRALAEFLRQSAESPTGLTRIRYWLRVLAKEYGSSPWVAISTVGAIILLLLTAAQVLCLFYPCMHSNQSVIITKPPFPKV